MKKVLIYTDAHFSLTSSIMNRVQGFEYSERLDLLVKSFKWIYELAKEEKVDMIINGGDLTDSDVLLPEEMSALAEAFKYHEIYKVPEYHLVGNHERKDKDGKHNSVALIDTGDEFREVLIENYYHEESGILFVPYTTDYDKVYEDNEKYQPKYIVSHGTYLGENFNKYVVFEGLDKERLINFNSNLIKIFNGHIHNARESEDGIYVQVGSLVGTSFSDSYAEGYPGVMVVDLSTGSYTRYANPYSSLYYKIKVNELSELPTTLNNIKSKIDPSVKLCIRVEVSLNHKDQVTAYLEKHKEEYNISSYRVKSIVTQDSVQLLQETKATDQEGNPIESLNSFDNAFDALLEFTKSQVDKLPAEYDDMVKFLVDHVGGDM